MQSNILDDVLDYKMVVVFCGMAVSTQSDDRKAYFAGNGNKFWRTLNNIGLTEIVLEPNKYKDLKKLGIGLTDIIKNQSGSDNAVKSVASDVDILKSKIMKYRPALFAFNGKKSAKLFFKKRRVEYGEQKDYKLGKTRIFVLPSTSGAASGYWNETYWNNIGNLVKEMRR